MLHSEVLGMLDDFGSGVWYSGSCLGYIYPGKSSGNIAFYV